MPHARAANTKCLQTGPGSAAEAFTARVMGWAAWNNAVRELGVWLGSVEELDSGASERKPIKGGAGASPPALGCGETGVRATRKATWRFARMRCDPVSPLRGSLWLL